EPRFLALAGMRSTPEHLCDSDDRVPLLERALNENQDAAGHLSTNIPETVQQRELLDLLQDSFKKPASQENVYALAPGQISLRLTQINSGSKALTLANFFKGMRVVVPYHFLAWTDTAGTQYRATLMETNRNRATAPLYGVKYDSGSRLAEIL